VTLGQNYDDPHGKGITLSAFIYKESPDRVPVRPPGYAPWDRWSSGANRRPLVTPGQRLASQLNKTFRKIISSRLIIGVFSDEENILSMPLHQLLVLLGLECALVVLPAPGLYRMFKKAGLPGWKALMPFYNTWIMGRLSHRPWYLFYCQFIPIVGWFITMGIFIDFVRCYGKYRFYQHALAALVPFFYFPYIGFDPNHKFTGPEKALAYQKSKGREWADAAIFAIIAATLIRTFVFEAYAIPTASMEKTLLVGDYLFVNKISYGPRIPNTPLAMPFIHNQLPFGRYRSYVEWIKLPYIRWFAHPITRGDVVVFNLPVGDTVIDLDDYDSKDPYYQVIRREGRGNVDEGRKTILSDPETYPILIRPVDKQENYVKRCVGLPGDSLQIIDQIIYINGRAVALPSNSETFYDVVTYGQPLDETVLKEEYDVDMNDPQQFQVGPVAGEYSMLLTPWARTKMLNNKLAKTVVPDIDSVKVPGKVFPFDQYHPWTLDEFGPMWIPKKGASVPLTAENYALYERIIRTYEGNKLEMKKGIIYLNDHPTNQYTFKMDYFWMMGDNRHNSQDARSWGFVPEDHIVGKASFVWMSYGGGVRWKRLFQDIR
jgi:signal peptidase I